MLSVTLARNVQNPFVKLSEGLSAMTIDNYKSLIRQCKIPS